MMMPAAGYWDKVYVLNGSDGQKLKDIVLSEHTGMGVVAGLVPSRFLACSWDPALISRLASARVSERGALPSWSGPSCMHAACMRADEERLAGRGEQHLPGGDAVMHMHVYCRSTCSLQRG